MAANYPFATIEPNVGVVPVPDKRLDMLAEITRAENSMSDLPPLKPATVEFVDIAGLVKGAHEGEGLGNKFLSHIREVKVIAHVVRAFEDKDVIREGSVGIREDYETITTELILADLETLSKVNEKTLRTDTVLGSAVAKLKEHLNTGLPARSALLTPGEVGTVKQLSLLTSKDELIVLNVSESDYQDANFEEIISEYSKVMCMDSNNFVVVSAKIEEELASLDEEDGRQYLKELGVTKSGLERLINCAYQKLELMSFLTCGEKEVRAWTVKVGANAVEASGEIHTDFMDKFIKAEVVSYSDFVECNGWKGARDKGKARLEGRDYTINDGDVIEFKIGR